MEISRDKIERLTFVKYLLSQANIQKDLERPLCSSAILTIHDSIECFLQLCFEIKTGKPKLNSQNILDTYSEDINKVLSTEGKPQINKAYIKRINDLRNQLKHATIFVDHKQIPNLYTETELFLIDFTELIFDLSFDKISLVELIPNEIIKQFLQTAEKQIENNELQNAMWTIGKTFYELKNYLTKVEGKYGENLLSKNLNINYLRKYESQFGGSSPDNILKENLKEIAEDINRLQDELQNIKTVLSLSVDLKEYIYFEQHMPYVSKIIKGETGNEEYWIHEEESKIIKEYKIEIVKNCLNFVIELALQNK
jgi:hypothetical protein